MTIPGIRSGHRKAPHRPYRRTSLLRPTAKTLGLRTLSGKLLFLLAVVLMAVAVTQKPSMLLLCITPKGMAATALRLFMGLLAAVVIKACIPGMARRSHALLGSRWNTLVAFALMLILLALMCSVLGSRAFSTLRLGDLVMHRAYVTQSLAFTVLWLATLR
jgi:hypothetical protein